MAIINQFPGGGSGELMFPSGYDTVVVPLANATNYRAQRSASSTSSHYSFYYSSSSHYMYAAYVHSSLATFTSYPSCTLRFFVITPTTGTIYIGGSSSATVSNNYASSNFTFMPGTIYKVEISRGSTTGHNSTGTITYYYGQAILNLYSDNSLLFSMQRTGRTSTAGATVGIFTIQGSIIFG